MFTYIQDKQGMVDMFLSWVVTVHVLYGVCMQWTLMYLALSRFTRFTRFLVHIESILLHTSEHFTYPD